MGLSSAWRKAPRPASIVRKIVLSLNTLAAGGHAYLTKLLDVRRFLQVLNEILDAPASDRHP